MQDLVDYIKVKEPAQLFTEPERVRPARKPDFTIRDDSTLWGKSQVHWWIKERICEFKDKESSKPELSYFMIDPVWGIFIDESWHQDRKTWNLCSKTTLDAYKQWALEKAVFDD